MWETLALEAAAGAFAEDGSASYSIPDELYSSTGNVGINVAGISGSDDMGSKIMIGVVVALSVLAVVAIVRA